MLSIFHMVVAIRVRLVLNKAIRFLVESKAAPHTVVRYRRIIRLSLTICTITVVFNFLLLAIKLGIKSYRQYFIHSLSIFSTKSILGPLNVVELILNLMFCLKPGFYGLAYVLVKLA